MAVNTNRFLPSSRGGALATTRPTATLVPYKKPAGGALVKQPTPDDEGDTKPSLEEDVAAIREKTKKIEKIIGKTLKLNKDTMRFEARTSQKDSRAESEKNREKKKFGIKMPKGLKIPKSGFLDNIRKFLGTVLLGRFMMYRLEYAPKIAEFIKFISPIATFVGDVVSGLVDKLVTAITFGYKVKDKVEEVTKNLFGDDGLKKFKDFQGHFTKFMNLALIAVMVGATAANDAGIGKKRLGGKPGQDLKGRRTTKSAQQRYRRRFGDRKFADRFGRKNLNRLTKDVTKKSTTKLANKAATGLGAKFAKTGAGKIIGKVPIVGPLIDFGVRAFILGEPLGKAAAGAVGAGVGQALGSFLGGAIGGIVGSVVPFVGNLLVGGAGATIGGLIGGIIGDQIGASLYNVLVGTESGGEGAESVEAKAQGGSIGDEDVKKQEEAERERIRRARVQQFNVNKQQTPAEKELSKDDPGEDKRTIFQKIFGVVKKGGPLELIKKARERLNKRNNSMISKIMSLGIDLLAGRRPARRVIGDSAKSLTTFFDAALPAPMTMLRQLLQKLQSGGMVVENPAQTQQRLREVTSKIQSALVRDATTVANGVLNDIKTTAEKTVLGPATAANPSTTRSALETSRQSNQARKGNRKASQGVPLSGGTGALMPATGTTGAGNVANPNASTSVSITPFAKGSGASISSAFGQRTLNGRTRAHNGLDIAAKTGTPMYAYLDGEVTHVNDLLGARGKDGGYGYWIVWKDDKNGHYHFFGHLDRPPALGVGKKFKAGALLGQVGGSGYGRLDKYGPHLHWEISKQAPSSNGQFSSYIDPIEWVNNHGASLTPPQAIKTSLNTNLTSSNVASNASYEQTGVQLAVITKEVPVTRTVTTTRTNHRGRPVTTKQPVISA